MRLLDLLMTLLTAVRPYDGRHLFVPYVDPGSVWFFPVLGLAAPAVYVASVVLTLYWIIRWRWCGRDHGRAGVVGLFKVSLFCVLNSAVLRDETASTALLQGYELQRAQFLRRGRLSSVGRRAALIGSMLRHDLPQEFNARSRSSPTSFAAGEKYESRLSDVRRPRFALRLDADILSKYRILRSDVVLPPRPRSGPTDVGDDTCGCSTTTCVRRRSTLDNDYITSHRISLDTARETKCAVCGPFAREQRASCRAGRQHRAGRGATRSRRSSAAISTIRPCRMSTARWRRAARRFP